MNSTHMVVGTTAPPSEIGQKRTLKYNEACAKHMEIRIFDFPYAR